MVAQRTRKKKFLILQLSRSIPDVKVLKGVIIRVVYAPRPNIQLKESKRSVKNVVVELFMFEMRL